MNLLFLKDLASETQLPLTCVSSYSMSKLEYEIFFYLILPFFLFFFEKFFHVQTEITILHHGVVAGYMRRQEEEEGSRQSCLACSQHGNRAFTNWVTFFMT